MKRVCGFCNGVYASGRGRLLLSVCAALGLYLLAALLQPVITFYDNDDLNIAWALAGYRGGAPSFAHPFLNPVTAFAVSGLYTLFPAVPWWYAVQTICMLLSAAVIANAVLKLCFVNGLPLPVPFFLLVLLFGGACYYALTQVMFTLTSALLGMAAVALVLSAEMDGPVAAARKGLAGSVCLLILSLLIRQSAGVCAACFYFGALAVRLLEALTCKQPLPAAVAPMDAPGVPVAPETRKTEPRPTAASRKTALRGICITAFAALLAAAALTAVNHLGRANQHTAGFLPFENARAAYMDYPHDTYLENPALYESIGWDESLYKLVNAWFYMDARVNADTLARAVGGSRVGGLSFPERAARGAEEFGVFLGKYPIAVYLCGITACAALALVFVTLLRRARPVALIGGIALLFGAAALMSYLLLAGRINLRTLMTVAFPAILSLLLLCVCAYGAGRAPGTGKKGHVHKAALACVCGALAVAALFCGYKIFRTAVSYDSTEALAGAHAVVDYARAHPENVYIRDVYVENNYDALTVYPLDPPVNLVDWGGCDMYTRAREEQWRANGYGESPYADVLLDDGVYYVGDPNGSYLVMLDAYMRAAWGAAGYEIVESITDNAAVVRFLQR